MAAIWVAMSSVALAVWLARVLTSLATTAKPLPASPARAASMVAFSASRLVWLAMSWMIWITSPILAATRPAVHRVVGTAGLVDGAAGDLGRLRHLAADLVDRGGQLFGRTRHRLHIARGHVRGGHHGGGLAQGLLGGGRHALRGAGH